MSTAVEVKWTYTVTLRSLVEHCSHSYFCSVGLPVSILSVRVYGLHDTHHEPGWTPREQNNSLFGRIAKLVKNSFETKYTTTLEGLTI